MRRVYASELGVTECAISGGCYLLWAASRRRIRPARVIRSALMKPRPFGAQSMTAPLREALVKRPGPAFGRAFADPAHGFLHPVDLPRSQREHDALRALLERLG